MLEGYGACITGGLHLKMPDSIGDEKALKRPLEKNKALVREAEIKIKDAARAKQAITLLGKRVVEQTVIEKYL